MRSKIIAHQEDLDLVNREKAKPAISLNIDQGMLIESINIDEIYRKLTDEYRVVITNHVRDDLDSIFHKKRNSKEHNGVGYEFLRDKVTEFVESPALSQFAAAVISEEFEKILRQKTADVLNARAGKMANDFVKAIYDEKVTPDEMRAMTATLRQLRS